MADRHALLATLDEDSPLSRTVDRFDPAGQAVLLVTDPLDPPALGHRRHLGGKHPSWAMFEYKSVVDTLWDAIGLPRAESLVFDQPGTLLRPSGLGAADIVLAAQRRGDEPSAGGGDVRLLTGGASIPVGPMSLPQRIRAMPALAGLPCRVHGLVLPETTAAFPPLELLVPHRPDDGTFLCAGAWPLPASEQHELVELTRRLGEALRRRLAYRGGFSVDGILTAEGFRATDLNTRVTSAFDNAAPAARVPVHASALLARDDRTGVDAPALAQLARDTFNGAHELILRTPVVSDVDPAEVPVRWTGTAITACTAVQSHGTIETAEGARGTVLTVRLHRERLPPGLTLQAAAVAAFGGADRLLGTQLGPLRQPERHAAPPRPDGAAPHEDPATPTGRSPLATAAT